VRKRLDSNDIPIERLRCDTIQSSFLHRLSIGGDFHQLTADLTAGVTAVKKAHNKNPKSRMVARTAANSRMFEQMGLPSCESSPAASLRWSQ